MARTKGIEMNASLHVLAPESLAAAVKEAARRDLTTSSEYIRRVLVARLRADGIDPVTLAPAGQKARAA
jgi:hypothetical protein